MVYLFNTFADQSKQLITTESLQLALRHLNIRESEDKIKLFLAFANDQPFLELILKEQMSGESAGNYCDVSGINFEAFKRTFCRSNFVVAIK